VLSKSSSERRVILFTGPSGVGKTAAVKHALRFLMNETSGLEGNPDVIVETLRLG
jgi:flagellar biosynthesis GTPase FlhF